MVGGPWGRVVGGLIVGWAGCGEWAGCEVWVCCEGVVGRLVVQMDWLWV